MKITGSATVNKLKYMLNEKFHIYLLYLWKKLRDSKIRTKLMVYVVLVAIISSTAVGGISYYTMKEALIDTAKDSAVSLLKQTGVRAEERIREFQDASYSLAYRQEISGLLNEDADTQISQWQYTLNQAALSSTFLMFNVLHKYSDLVIMGSKSGNVYFYDQSPKKAQISLTEAREILSSLEGEVQETSPVKWLKKGTRIYFIRRVVRPGGTKGMRSLGTMVFAISEKFFELEDEDNPYVSDENLIVTGADGSVYKNNSLNQNEETLEYYTSFRDGRYYVYTSRQEIDGKNYLVVPMRTVRFRWNIICFIPYSLILERANSVIPKVAVTTLILLGVGLLLGLFLYKMLKKNLEIIEQGMRQYETGNYSRRLSPACYDEIGLLILQFNHMGLKINELNELTLREEEEKQELEYQVMEAQINPHFLYNTLGSLKWLAYEKEQEEIALLADAIINLLRFTVKHANQFITLGEELDYTGHYIYIQQARYEDAFRVDISVTEEARAFEIVGFVLQPFIENSILHGLDTARTDGVIAVRGEVADGRLCLSVADNGMGMKPEQLLDLKQKIEENKTERYKGFNGIGMTNIILRLRMIYGSGFEYQIESEAGKGTSITLMIPERISGDEEESTDS